MKKHNKVSCRFVPAFIVGLLLAIHPIASAQDATGRIAGTVTDPTGAVIVGAKVSVTNMATRITRETVTASDGSYQVPSLPLGMYRVTVEHQGFKRLVSSEQTLQINQVLRFDPVLEIGASSESVEVTVASSTVETVNPTLGQSVTGRQIVNAPLNGRNVLNLALLQAGVTETNPGDGGAGSFSVAGGRADHRHDRR